MTHPIVFTPEMDEAICAARARGLTIDDIALWPGLNFHAVQKRVSELGERAVRPSPLSALKEHIRKLWGEGLTTVAIAARLNISKNSVIGHVHRMRLAGRPSPIKPRDPNKQKEPRKSRLGGAAVVERAKRVTSVAVPKVFIRAAVVRVPPAPAVPRAPRVVRLSPPAWNSVAVSAARTCQYPEWDDDPRCHKTEFCGARCVILPCDDGTEQRSSYCLEHHVLCHKPLRSVAQDAPESEAA